MADRIQELRALHGRWTRGGTIIGSPLGYTLVPAGWDGDAPDLRHQMNTGEIKHLLHALPLLLGVAEAARKVERSNTAMLRLLLSGGHTGEEFDAIAGRQNAAMTALRTALAALEGVGDA